MDPWRLADLQLADAARTGRRGPRRTKPAVPPVTLEDLRQPPAQPRTDSARLAAPCRLVRRAARLGLDDRSRRPHLDPDALARSPGILAQAARAESRTACSRGRSRHGAR